MRLVRRIEQLKFANTCCGTRFPMYLGMRVCKHRWNNPSLYNCHRENVQARCPHPVDVILVGQPVKRIYRGFLDASRYACKAVERPAVVPGSSFLQTFERVADRLGRGPRGLTMADFAG